jgi:GMP synthase (glutamine-hydrolysing)
LDPEKFIKEKVDELKKTIEGKAIIALSGGVDSSVAAAITSMAIGGRLTAVFVDTGYMRKNEAEEVRKIFEKYEMNFRIVDASEEFYEALKGVVDPERKRKIIGAKFIDVFKEVADEIGAEYLVQGTIAPDWIESGGELRDTIKSHHNVGGLPKKIGMKLVEPLRDLYKDEVRELARYLELEVVERQPFPGPGLAIRIIGEASPERVEVVREANYIVEQEIDKAVKEGKITRPWQYFAVLLPVKTVGVHGDLRAYGETIVVRAVESIDAMSATYSKIPHEILDRISIRITNELGDRVNRVVYDITNKPPGTIEWE